MYLNLFRPGKSVQSAVDNPNMGLAFFLVLLPTVATTVGYYLFGFPMPWDQMLLSFVRSVLNWLVLSIAAFVILYLAVGKKMQGKFKSTASALSLLWIVSLVLTILGMIFLPLVFSPELMQEARYLATGQSTLEEFGVAAFTHIEQNPAAVNTAVALIGIAIGVLLTLFSFYLVYLLVRDLYQGGFIKNIIATVVVLLAWWFIAAWIFYLL